MSFLFAPVSLCLRRFGSWRWCHRCWRRSHRGRGRCRCGMRGRGMSRRRSRHDHARRLCSCCAAGNRQQTDVARPLDGHAQPTLMPRTHAGHTPRQNLPALLHELREDVRALVVDEVHLLDAELAHLFLPEILALAARPASRTAGTTAAWSTFPPWTAVPASLPLTPLPPAPTFPPPNPPPRSPLLLTLSHPPP